uniref:Uncharacterized protein n=1 Tax=Candidatus Kentrum sp. FW TaxID=2126338 RepID=A0A450SR61_9GAMM|nr:MAG: hypothetical protein BECKFW1821B_GA0114236_102823 [Candidatus Kentron sp. FW]
MKDDLTRNISGSDSAKLCLTTPQERTTYPPHFETQRKMDARFGEKEKGKT